MCHLEPLSTIVFTVFKSIWNPVLCVSLGIKPAQKFLAKILLFEKIYIFSHCKLKQRGTRSVF